MFKMITFTLTTNHEHILKQISKRFVAESLGGSLHMGGSRTCRRRGRQPIKRGRQPNIFYIFSEKPHEIKEILVCRGGARRERPSPLDPPLLHQFFLTKHEGVSGFRERK